MRGSPWWMTGIYLQFLVQAFCNWVIEIITQRHITASYKEYLHFPFLSYSWLEMSVGFLSFLTFKFSLFCLTSMSRTAIVVFQLFYKMVLGKSFNWEAIIKFLIQVSLGAYVSLTFTGHCNAHVSCMTLTLIQCRNWTCFWNSISAVARFYFQWHSYRNYFDTGRELYCLFHCKFLVINFSSSFCCGLPPHLGF